MTIGEKIRLKRKEKNLTQKELGALCGLHDVMIRQYETGTRNPKIATLSKIAKALDIHGSYFLEVEQDEETTLEMLLGMNFPTMKNYAAVLNISIVDAIRKLEGDIPSEYKNITEDTTSESVNLQS